MNRLLLGFFALVLAASCTAQTGYKVGDVARDFSLKNVDGKVVSMKDFADATGFIVVFTCNSCPYAKAYEQRIMDLHARYASKGYPVIAINPNDAGRQPEDSFENMVKRAREKGYAFPYLHDETQEIATAYGATRTPHVYLLEKTSKGLEVVYIGAIDDSVEDAGAAKVRYVEAAIDALSSGQKPATSSTKAIGCTIKWKKSS
jgi:peroxiredoxin